MSQKITKLTRVQEDKIPDFIAKWVAVASRPTDKDKATKAVKDMYKAMGQSEPLVVFGDSPYSTSALAALFFTLVKPSDKKKGGQLDDQLGGQLGDQLGGQLRGQLGDQLDGQLYGQLRGQLGDQLGGQLRGQLGDQLGDQLRGQLRGQLYDQLDDQLGDQLDDQLDGQLDDQLRDQLGGQLGDQLDDQLRDQLGDQLDGQLRDQLRDQLYGQLRDQLRDQLYGQLYGQLADQLDGQLDDQLRGQLGDQLDGQLYDQLRGQLRDQLYGQLYDQLRDQLDGQLRGQLKAIRGQSYMTTFWLAWAGWYDYGQYIGVEFDQEKLSLFTSFLENVGFVIPYKGIVFVSCAPTKIVWENRLLSYDHGQAVEYADGWGVYCLDGVRFEKDEWTKIVNQDFSLEDLAKSSMGADKSAVAIKYLRPDRLLEHCKAKLIHTGIKGTRLYQVDNFMDTATTQYCMRMKHPSIDREYIEWVHPDIGKQANADLAQAAAWRDKDGDHIPVEDYLLAIEA